MKTIHATTCLQDTTKYGYNNMIIYEKKSPVTGVLNTMSINTNPAEVAKWISGTLIQEAMPNATAEEREFLISGCTASCWDQLKDPNEFGTHL